ncbi:hypothetical protein Y032_0057g2797 [Ancylostoma ceylanicum]|uniref:Uncharacterized protein n=1 Tax=Ancylostoma ceylanicum TaxID=53326 RepID=A0A016U4T5_9BILA|nr:hypothetical protein Y032_0057g2797 [Ancylostoma ceylanicum]
MTHLLTMPRQYGTSRRASYRRSRSRSDSRSRSRSSSRRKASKRRTTSKTGGPRRLSGNLCIFSSPKKNYDLVTRVFRWSSSQKTERNILQISKVDLNTTSNLSQEATIRFCPNWS